MHATFDKNRMKTKVQHCICTNTPSAVLGDRRDEFVTYERVPADERLVE